MDCSPHNSDRYRAYGGCYDVGNGVEQTSKGIRVVIGNVVTGMLSLV